MTAPDIDLGGMPEAEQLPALRKAFDNLGAGETLLLTTAQDPRKLMRALIAEHWGQFHWAPLREGGGAWLSKLGRRERPGPESLDEFLSEDNRRCDELFVDAEQAAQNGDLERASESFAQFDLGLERHLRIEEEGFFTEMDRRMGFMGGGPVAVMREEHQQLRGMLRQMATAIAQPDLDKFGAACETMLFLMEQHNIKEEQMLYPMADEAFAGETEDLLKQLILY